MGNKHTAKIGNYGGRGRDLAFAVMGEHAPQGSPFWHLPAYPDIALASRDIVYRTSNAPYSVDDFTSTIVGAGGSIAKSAGGLLFTNDAADNDLCQLQLLESYTPAAGKVAVYYVRVQVSDATQSDTYLGWAPTDTSLVASIPSHHAIFKKDDGDTILNGATKDGTTGSETANLITDWTAATDYDLGIAIVPTSTTAGSIFFSYKLASATTWAQVTKTSNFPATALRPSFLNQNGEAVAKTMTIKKWLVYWEN